MTTILINANTQGEKRAAIVKNGKLIDFETETHRNIQNKDNIFLGTISTVEPSLNCLFIDIGLERHGFLPLNQIHPSYMKSIDGAKNLQTQLSDPEDDAENENKHHGPKINITELFDVGMKILVQVKKDGRGTKGATLTTYIKLPAGHLVLLPMSKQRIGISKNTSEKYRDQILEKGKSITLPQDTGIIIRTAGIHQEVPMLQSELDMLYKHWLKIKKLADDNQAPLLIHEEGGIVLRTIRDKIGNTIDEIVVDDAACHETIKNFLEDVKPDALEKLKLHSSNHPLFAQYGVEHEIDNIFKREINLKSGGSIVFDTSEALTSIDVNSARATKGSDINATALNTNLEAAKEIAKQIRFKDIGGLIVIDFIDMLNKQHRDQVEKKLEEALQQDKAKIQISSISKLGLLTVSRQRLHNSILENHFKTCSHCNGRGMTRTVESVSNEIIRKIQEKLMDAHASIVRAYCNDRAAIYLLNEHRRTLSEIEARLDITIHIIPNPNYESDQYQIKLYYNSQLETTHHSIPSKLQEEKKLNKANNQKQGLVSLYGKSQKMHSKTQETGLIKRLWQSILGEQESPKKQKKSAPKKRQNQRKLNANSNRSHHGNRNRRHHGAQHKKTTHQQRHASGENNHASTNH